MPLDFYQADPDHQQRFFASPHWVHTEVANGRQLVTITGIAKLEFFGEDSAQWRREQLRLHLNFPPIFPAGMWFRVEHWAPFVTISGVHTGGDNHNGGWAIDEFGLVDPPVLIAGVITIWANIRVRGAGFSLFRVGYTLTVSGVFVERPRLPSPDG
jgi:hypothetical protein